MNVKIRNDVMTDVSAGRVDNESFWFKFGEGEIDTALTTCWSGSAVQSGVYEYPTEAINMYLESTNAGDDQDVVIGGIDANWKLQSEVITLDGTTPVASVYKYLAVYRMSVIGGSDLAGTLLLQNQAGTKLYAHIDNGGEKVNQSQMVLYQVPAGHSLFIKRLSITKLDDEPVKIFGSIKEVGKYGTDTPFRAQLNYNLSTDGVIDETPHPFPITEKTYLEFRGIAATVKTSDIAINLWGHLERNNSVPIDLSNFAATAGVEKITLSWDEQTPAETADAKGFVVELWQGIDKLQERLLAKDATGHEFTGLSSDLEYTVKAYWLGYDDRKSTVESSDVTPLPIPVPSDTFYITGSFNPAGTATSDFAYSTDGESWTVSTLADKVEYNMDGGVAGVGGKVFAVISPSEGDAELVTWTDVDTYTYDTSVVYFSAHESNGLALISTLAGGYTLSTDGENWTTPTTPGLTTVDGLLNLTSGIYITDGTDIYKSSDDGDVFTVLDNMPAEPGSIGGIDGLIVSVATSDLDAAVVEYTTDDGATAWTVATTGLSGTYAVSEVVGFGDKVYALFLDDDYAGGDVISSSDGITWSAVSIPTVAGETAIGPLNISKAGDNLYLNLIDPLTFDGYQSISSDGTVWSDPVKIFTAALGYKVAKS
jgi:hypothetical protein